MLRHLLTVMRGSLDGSRSDRKMQTTDPPKKNVPRGPSWPRDTSNSTQSTAGYFAVIVNVSVLCNPLEFVYVATKTLVPLLSGMLLI